MCEPQMSKRGLYPTLSTKGRDKKVRLMMDLISLCDGQTPLLEIAEYLNLPIWELYDVVDELKDHRIIEINKKK